MSRSGDALAPPRWEKWRAPVLPGTQSLEGTQATTRLTARDVETIQEQAYEEGFRRGHDEGIALGREKIAHLVQLLTRLREPLADLDDAAERELVSVVKVVARQLVRREMKTDPGQIIAVVREAVAALPARSRDIRIHLHPDDAALVRELLAASEPDSPWALVEDPLLVRGDCRVSTETSSVDAGVEARLSALVTAMLGGERRDDTSRDS